MVCTVAHIYRELKTEAEDLPRKALDQNDGVWEMSELEGEVSQPPCIKAISD